MKFVYKRTKRNLVPVDKLLLKRTEDIKFYYIKLDDSEVLVLIVLAVLKIYLSGNL